ncbi:MAG: transposase [Gaiellaceae bacterium]
MPRRPREEAPGAIHHVVAKGNAGGFVAYDDYDRTNLFHRFEWVVERCRWSCLAYCLLDTHLHLVLNTPEPNLGLGMQRFQAPYAQSFNRRHTRDGHLFRGRYYSARLRTDRHLYSAIIYVLMNPVRAGVVQRPELWRWSSYAATIGHEPAPAYLDVAAALELIDPDPIAARRRLEEATREARERDLLSPSNRAEA